MQRKLVGRPKFQTGGPVSKYTPAVLPLRPGWPRRSFLKLLVSILAFLAVQWLADPRIARLYAAQAQDDLTSLSLEDLMDIEITSVSRKVQKLSDAAAAVFVITQEDIRRSGVTSIAEALRMVPGLDVARIDSNKWAVSSRGFNGRFANKLLVLMDGRSVYTPLFSGTLWEVIDTVLEDIDRIEVIRGPGAAMWGANAVNGVINIITKHSKDTQGGLITAGGGTVEQGFGSARFGGKSGDDLYYRVYGKYFNRGTFMERSGADGADSWDAFRGGFRADYKPSLSDSFTFQGEGFKSNNGTHYELPTLDAPFLNSLATDTDFSGGNVLGRWNHTISTTSDLTLQLYYDRLNIGDVQFKIAVDIFDLDFQHQFRAGDYQNVIWGLGYRFAQSATSGSFTVTFDPSERQLNLFSWFLQDEISLIPDKLRMIVGSKFEHNDFTGFEIQPNARLLWTPDKHNTVWAAVSRAVRTPSIGESDIRFNSTVIAPGTSFNTSSFPLSILVLGNNDLASEKLVALEAGYRFQPREKLSFDIVGFYNMYDQMLVGTLGSTSFQLDPVPHIVTTTNTINSATGKTYGVELSAEWQPYKWWRLMASYTCLQMDLDSGLSLDDGRSPRNQFSFRSWFDLPHNFEFDLWLRYVDSLSTGNIPSYVTMDARLGWKPIKNLELSIVGQNLFQSHHAEFAPDVLGSVAAEVSRAVYGKVVWRF